MFVTIETQTEQFLLNTNGCKLLQITPPQDGESPSIKTKTLLILDDDGGVRNSYNLEPGDFVFIMNDAGHTIHKYSI